MMLVLVAVVVVMVAAVAVAVMWFGTTLLMTTVAKEKRRTVLLVALLVVLVVAGPVPVLMVAVCGIVRSSLSSPSPHRPTRQSRHAKTVHMPGVPHLNSWTIRLVGREMRVGRARKGRARKGRRAAIRVLVVII
jgi:hypothetical protein